MRDLAHHACSLSRASAYGLKVSPAGRRTEEAEGLLDHSSDRQAVRPGFVRRFVRIPRPFTDGDAHTVILTLCAHSGGGDGGGPEHRYPGGAQRPGGFGEAGSAGADVVHDHHLGRGDGPAGPQVPRRGSPVALPASDRPGPRPRGRGTALASPAPVRRPLAVPAPRTAPAGPWCPRPAREPPCGGTASGPASPTAAPTAFGRCGAGGRVQGLRDSPRVAWPSERRRSVRPRSL